MSRFISRFVIFSKSKKSNIPNPTVFAGGANSRRWGRAGPSRRRPAQRVIFQNHGPKPDQVCEIPVPRDVGPAPPASFQSHWSSARPGPRDSHNIFAVSSCCVSFSSRFRGSSVLVSPGPAASLGSRSLSTIGTQSRVCHAPIPAFGYRWCGVGYVVPYHEYIDPRQNVSNRDFLLGGKA